MFRPVWVWMRPCVAAKLICWNHSLTCDHLVCAFVCVSSFLSNENYIFLVKNDGKKKTKLNENKECEQSASNFCMNFVLIVWHFRCWLDFAQREMIFRCEWHFKCMRKTRSICLRLAWLEFLFQNELIINLNRNFNYTSARTLTGHRRFFFSYLQKFNFFISCNEAEWWTHREHETRITSQIMNIL